MAKSKYELFVRSRFADILKWLNEGLYEKDIIKRLCIGKTTWEKYKNEYSELAELLKSGRQHQIAEVEASLFKTATGYTYTEQQAFKLKRVFWDENDRRCEEERIEVQEVQKYKPGETGAASFYLINRDRKNWGVNPALIDLRREQFEHQKKMDEENNF